MHATLIFSYALLMGFGSWLIIFATTAAFTPETTIRWLTATAFSLVLAMFVFDPIKIVLFGPVYHHMQFILRHKKAVGAIGAVLTAVAYAHEVKETRSFFRLSFSQRARLCSTKLFPNTTPKTSS